MTTKLTVFRVVSFGFSILGLLVGLGTVIVGQVSVGLNDLFGAGIWFLFFVIGTLVQNRLEERRQSYGYSYS